MISESKKFCNLWLSVLLVYLVEFGFVIIDSLMVAPFGAKYLAGVGISGICYCVMLSFSHGFVSIIINLYTREISSTKAKEVNNFDSTYLIILSIMVCSHSILAIIILRNLHYLMKLIHQPEEVLFIVQSSLNILCFAYPISLLLGAINMFLRVHDYGHKLLPTFLVGLSVNICGNWIFLYKSIFAFMQPQIAVASATIISELVMLGINILLCKNLIKFRIIFSHIFNLLPQITRQILYISKKSFSVGLRNVSDWLSSLLLVFFVNSLGTNIGAANQIADTASSMMYRPTQAACVAISIFYSRFIGRNEFNLDKDTLLHELKNLLVLSAIPAFVLTACFFIFRNYIPKMFGFNSHHVIHSVSISILNIHILFFTSYFLQHTLNAFLDALLDTEIPSIVTFIIYYLFIVPVAFYAVFYESVSAPYVWAIEGVGLTILAIFNLGRILKVTNPGQLKLLYIKREN